MQDENWFDTIQKELDQFQKNEVQNIVELPKNK